MAEIDWYGNGGRCYPLPGTVKEARCGVCGALMNVVRDVVRTTSLAEALSDKGGHRCDAFTCPKVKEGWHERIYALKMDVYRAGMNRDIDYDKKKAAAEKEIQEILAKYAAR